MYLRSVKYLKLFAISLIILESLILSYFMRPIQDDYFNLQAVQQLGVLGYLEDMWNSHGGNVVQFFIHCIMILPTTQHFVFWNFSLFFLLTQILVFFSARAINSWLFESPTRLTRFWVPLLVVAGFEGLFVPGFLGAYGFSLASLAHLWPVMAFTYALLVLRSFKGSWMVALLLGLIAGNSNLGESAFACGVWLSTFIAFQFIPNFEEKVGIKKDRNFSLLGLGVFLGTCGIIAAPGFWDRASDQVGLPASLGEFFRRLAKSFASFTADGLTHPMMWVLFFLGVIVAGSGATFISSATVSRVKALIAGSILIWLSLIMGSTFAYPAWHQSMGMYVLLMPLSFALGYTTRVRFSKKFLTILFVVSTLVMTLTFIRIGVLGVERSQRWERNLVENSCRIAKNPNAKLLGAEIQYPPFGLGVDDVNTWEWMRSKYVGWVEGIPEKRCG